MTCALCPADFSALLERARLGNEDAFAALVKGNLPLVTLCVRRLYRPGREWEEMYQQGCLGLVKALRRYNPDLGTSFSTYAVPTILGEIRTGCRADAPLHVPRTDREQAARVQKTVHTLTNALGREPTMTELALALRTDPAELAARMEAMQMPLSLDAPVCPEGGTLSDVLSDNSDFTHRIEMQDLLSRLPENEKMLLRLRYSCHMTQQQTARLLRTGQVQVSRMEKKLRQHVSQLMENE